EVFDDERYAGSLRPHAEDQQDAHVDERTGIDGSFVGRNEASVHRLERRLERDARPEALIGELQVARGWRRQMPSGHVVARRNEPRRDGVSEHIESSAGGPEPVAVPEELA